MLEAAGHIVIARNLLAEPWSAKDLRSFFGSTPVAAWFNPAAPRVKSGEVLPEKLDPASAIALMLYDPLLIRRPLVEVEGQRCAGFDRQPVTSLLGGPVDGDNEACSRPQAAAVKPISVSPCASIALPSRSHNGSAPAAPQLPRGWPGGRCVEHTKA